MSVIADSNDSRVKPRLTRFAALAFVVAILATVIDSLMSFYSIEAMGYAQEANPILDGLAQQVGFGWAMVIRALVGILLLIGLFLFSRLAHNKSERTLAARGLILVSIILTLISVYHFVGLLFFS